MECSKPQLPAACPTPIFTQTSSANASIWCRVRSRWERGIGCETRQPQCELGEDSRSISPRKSPLDLVGCRLMGNHDEWYYLKQKFYNFCSIHFLTLLQSKPFKIPWYLSVMEYGFVSAFEILHKYTSLGGQPLCCEFWQPACYSRLRRHSRHEGFNNGVLLAYSFASNETQPTFWTVNRSSLLPVRKLKAKRAAMFTLQN